MTSLARSLIRSVARSFIPAATRQSILAKLPFTKKRPVQEIFATIYASGAWGESDDFNSGDGSRDPGITVPYVKVVGEFLGRLSNVKAVDLGCGDFAVGSQLVPFCREYVACDVVPDLVERNRIKFVNDRLSFKVLNLIEDELPEGDIVFLRQVLQHLSNADIAKVLPKLNVYKYLVLTEHIPVGSFKANHDTITGAATRLHLNSGVVLDKSPFGLKYDRKSVLCSLPFGESIIETVLYEGPHI